MKIARTIATVLTFVLLLGTLGGVGAQPPVGEPQDEGGIGPQALVTPLLQYQGRLSDPGTGDPVPDGTYQISFRLYTVETGGTSVWSETKDVQVTGGLLSTPLGAVTPLDPHLFNGQMLWLALKVEADAEATPRQPVLPVAYALSLVPGAMVQGDSAPVLEVNHSAAGEALRVTGDLNVTGSLTGGAHTHDGEAITSGTVAEGHIDPAIARDAEVAATFEPHAGDPAAHHPRYTDDEAWGAVLDRDGPTSGLNADLLDGVSAEGFAAAEHLHDARYYTKGESEGRYVNVDGPEAILGKSADAILAVVQTSTGPALYAEATTGMALHAEGSAVVVGNLTVSGALIGGSHTHDGEAIQGGTVHEKYIDPAIARDNEVMPIVLANDGSGSGLNADYLDGYSSSSFSLTSHTHDERYVNVTGDTMSGALTVPYVNYTSARTHYFVVGGEGFVPRSNVDYFNTGGTGGAYIVSGYGPLVAPVHLPHGAVVTAFTVYYYDNSASDLSVSLQLKPLAAGGGYYYMAEVATSGASTSYRNGTDTSIGNPTVDNTTYSYHVYAYCSSWSSSNTRIMGAVVRYTISQAP